MKDNQTKPLQAVLHGMDGRTYKTMVMYFQGPCKGAAVVVEDVDAEVDIVDIDFPPGKEAFEKLKGKGLSRPVILLSREEVQCDGCIYVEKPIRLSMMLSAFEQAKTIISAKGLAKPLPTFTTEPENIPAAKTEAAVTAKKSSVDSNERKKNG